MTTEGISITPCAKFESEKKLQQYEKMTCIFCGEPLKKYMAHYPREAHIRCLLSKFKKSELTACWFHKT